MTLFLVPIVGMLCGASVSGITVAVKYLLKEFQYVNNVFFIKKSSSFLRHGIDLERTEIKLKFIWLSEQLG